MKSRKIHNKKNKTKTKKQKQRKSRFFAGGPKEDYELSQMEEGRIKGEREGEREGEEEEKEEYILDDMEEGQLSPDYLLKKMQRKREKEERRRKMELANIPFSAFAQKTETEKEIDAFHRRKAVQNLKYLDAVKNNEQYLKYNPAESLREREAGHYDTVSAPIDPATGEPFVSHNDPDIRPLNLHGERLEENEDWGQIGHNFEGGKTKRNRNKRQRKRKTRRSNPSRK